MNFMFRVQKVPNALLQAAREATTLYPNQLIKHKHKLYVSGTGKELKVPPGCSAPASEMILELIN